MNFVQSLMRAPSYHFEVFMERARGMNANQNARKRIAYVTAPNADDAKREAKKQFPEFVPQSARRV